MKVFGPEEFPVPCEVYSRIVGYLRPVNQWNDGKQAEFAIRKTYDRAFKAEVRAEKAVSKELV